MSYGNDTPLPTYPGFAAPLSKTAQEARRLYDAATEARALTGKIGEEGRAAYDELLAAKHELEAQRVKPSERDVKAELRLAEKVKTCEVLADPLPFRARSNNAAGEAERAVIRYRSYVREHGPELLEELRPEAEEIAKRLADALDKLRPLQEARAAVVARVSAVTACLPPDGDVDHRQWWPSTRMTESRLCRCILTGRFDS
jgi:hypothetical protein